MRSGSHRRRPTSDVTGKIPDAWRGPMCSGGVVHMIEEYALHNGHADYTRFESTAA